MLCFIEQLVSIEGEMYVCLLHIFERIPIDAV